MSEPSVASISGQLEELYLAHSRKDMNDTLTGVLLSACASGAAMPGRLVMEHVLLLSVLHHTVGVEVRSLSPRDGRVQTALLVTVGSISQGPLGLYHIVRSGVPSSP